MKELSSRIAWSIDRTYDGQPAHRSDRVEISFELRDRTLVIDVDGPWHRSPLPPGPPGPTDGLWDYDVVELFLLGAEERYLEIELGPAGHHLLLELHGRRHPVRTKLPIDYRALREGGRWRGAARIPGAYLPPRLERGNAYAIFGRPPSRRYLAHYPVLGTEPDFHRLEHFGPLR